MPLAVLLLVPAIAAPTVVIGYDEYAGARKKRNEKAAVQTLRDLVGAQASFREGDRDNDTILDYATNLAELEKAGLIDSDFADGIMRGYSFGLSGSTFDWLATATPVSPRSGGCNLTICTDGVVRFARKGPAACSHPNIQ